MTDENAKPEADLIELTTNILAAYVSNNPVPTSELPRFIADIHAAVAGVAARSRHIRSQVRDTGFPDLPGGRKEIQVAEASSGDPSWFDAR